jgi:hypothetical protein
MGVAGSKLKLEPFPWRYMGIHFFPPQFRRAAAGSLVKVAVTLDDLSLSILDILRSRQNVSRNEACRHIIGSVANDVGGLARFRPFVCNTWPGMIHHHETKRVIRFDWPCEVDASLIELSRKVLGRPKRSELFRILIAWYAIEQRVAEVVSVKRLSLRLKGSVEGSVKAQRRT